MVQNRNLLSVIVLASTLAFSSCTLSKMVKLAKKQELTVTPSPLEVHADEVKFNMSATLPLKMLKKKTTYTANVAYVYGNQRQEVGNVEFKAEDFPNAKKEQPKVSKDLTFAYVDAMQRGELMVKGIAGKGTKTKETPEMSVALGVITTSKLVRDANVVALADHGYNNQPEFEPTSVEFYFLQGSSVLRPVETKSKRGGFLNAFIAEKNVTKTVTLTGTHSPEGEETINEKLADERAKSIEKFYRGQLKKFDYKKAADSIEFVTKAIVQDWTMFKDTLTAYNGITQEQKDQIAAVVDGGAGSFVEKERELKKLPFYAKLMKDVYPKLRTAETEILSLVPKRPDAEISALASQIASGGASADTLNDKELGYAATLTPDLNEKKAIYEAWMKKTDSWEAHNNFGAMHLELAKKESDAAKKGQLVDAAITHLQQSVNKKENAEAFNNLAVAYTMKGQKAEAATAIDKAAGLGGGDEVTKSINSAKGALQIKAAQYAQAIATLTNAGQSSDVLFNKGLAQVLNKEYDKALATFTEVTTANPEDALGFYVAAIAAARLKREDQLTVALAKAISLNSDLRAKALQDLEFNAYANSETFKNAVK
ncbi:MAG: tetratricopeptide repeat protein [Bacteroidota bacterium]